MPDQMQNPGEAEGKNLPAEEAPEEDVTAKDVDLELPADYQEYIAGGQECRLICTHST